MTALRRIVYGADIAGTGPVVVMIPSLGRGGADFSMLAKSLREGGFRTISLTPQVHPADSPQTFEDLADDVLELIGASSADPVHLVGHAYGQALSRCIAARHSAVLRSLVLLACGGSIPDDEIRRSLAAATTFSTRSVLSEEAA